MEKRWEIKTTKKIKDEDELLNVLLSNRDIKTKQKKEEFLNPKSPQEYSVHDVGIDKKNLNKAIERIKKAISTGEEILVYGDYDADGICGTAIMWEALDRLHAKAIPYIPNRFEDGYGLNVHSIKKLKDKHPNLKLLITVDNGIVAFDGVDKANDLGIDVIITDHHASKEKMPKAHSIVHTTQTSGSGVAYLFAQEFINKTISSDNSVELATIGTVADQLPLLDFNRSLVKHGLLSLSKTQRIGLKKLFVVSGLLGKPIGTYEVNFMIAPRINASGRMAEGMDALRLLCTRNMGRAQSLAEQLNSINLDRQNTVEEALKLAEQDFSQKESSVIVLSSQSYHEGIIGLIASRIVEKYYRPTIVLSVKGEIAKASARSIAGFNIIDAIRFHEDLILEGGGHEMAAGFSINITNIELFTNKINEYAKPLLSNEVLDRKVKIDCLLDFHLINQKAYNILRSLEPHGTGNPAPLFASKNVKVVSQKLVGKESNHLKLVLESENKKINAMIFNQSETIESEFIDVAYRMSENTWNGNTSIEMMIKDFRESK